MGDRAISDRLRAAVAADEVERQLDDMIEHEADPVVRLLMIRDCVEIVAALVSATLAANRRGAADRADARTRRDPPEGLH